MSEPGVTGLDGRPDADRSFHPNDHLVDAIVRAWTDEGFRTTLLTYPTITSAAAWSGREGPNYENSRLALAAVDVFLDRPVVLSPSQYQWGYQKTHDAEVVFVLPEAPPLLGRRSLATARTAMAMTARGM